MAGRGHDADRGRAGGVGAAALAMLALGACYPNPDALRVDRSGIGSGGATGFAGMTGAAGHNGAGGALGTAGNGGGNNQCGAPACGGNLLDNWTFTTSCMGVSPVATCAGEMIDASAVHRAGTLTFNSNGTYSTTETDTGTFVFDFPTACLSGVTCAALQTTYQGPGYVGQPNPTFSSATCSTTTTGCRCLFGALGMPKTDTGTYVVSGTSVTATSAMGGVAADTFCVTGSILHMIYADSTPSSPDELFLMKQ
jgi:collagen type VII alpha